jgi:hypothetical protein
MLTGKQLHVPQMIVLPSCSWSSSPRSVVSAFHITVLGLPEPADEGTTIFWNIGNYLSSVNTWHSRRPESFANDKLWERSCDIDWFRDCIGYTFSMGYPSNNIGNWISPMRSLLNQNSLLHWLTTCVALEHDRHNKILKINFNSYTNNHYSKTYNITHTVMSL